MDRDHDRGPAQDRRDLAEVLEAVANTIRETDSLRRQMPVLSAESRISVVVLTVYPVLVAV